MSPITTKRQECIVYSRVVGWYTPVQNWNKGKKSEYGDRNTYEICSSCEE
ncbi:MAG: anaerobic ribonucleoside-triphosphate reductase [Patescibacteria group bacterium]|nr:anaerobic ribonucleoside-triphosphate reductase [Patescibacteria group bacterium]